MLDVFASIFSFLFLGQKVRWGLGGPLLWRVEGIRVGLGAKAAKNSGCRGSAQVDSLRDRVETLGFNIA